MALKVLTPCPLTQVSATHAQCLLLQRLRLPEAACRACLLTPRRRKHTTTTDSSTMHHRCSPLTSRDRPPALKIAQSTDRVAMSRARWDRHLADLLSLVPPRNKTRRRPTATPAKAVSMYRRAVMKRRPNTSMKPNTLTTGARMTMAIATISTTLLSFHLSNSLSTLISPPRCLAQLVIKVKQGVRHPGVRPLPRRTIPLRATIHLRAVTM